MGMRYGKAMTGQRLAAQVVLRTAFRAGLRTVWRTAFATVWLSALGTALRGAAAGRLAPNNASPCASRFARSPLGNALGDTGRVSGPGERERCLAVEQQDEILLAQCLLERLEREARIFGADLAQGVEGAFVDAFARHADIDQRADQGFARAALGDACLEFGDALLDECHALAVESLSPTRACRTGEL